jgi:urease beta subunit
MNGATTDGGGPVVPGELLPADGEIALRPGVPRTALRVVSTADRPIQVGSHFHLFEANRALRFDRVAALGMHLDLPAGTAVRFEPGDTHEVQACAYGGLGFIAGFSGLVQGSLRARDNRARAIQRMRELGFLEDSDSGSGGGKKDKRKTKKSKKESDR